MEMSNNKATSTSLLKLRDEKRTSSATDNESSRSASLAFDQIRGENIPAFSFLKLPAELRIQIYRYLLCSPQDILIYPPKILWIENMKIYGDKIKYGVTADGIHPAILSANKQTSLEASRILYSENRFSFKVDELDDWTATMTVVPFLEDRSQGSRHSINEIEYCFFVNMCTFELDLATADGQFKEFIHYLNKNLQLEHLTLSLFGLFDRADYMVLGKDFRGNLLSGVKFTRWVQYVIPLVKKLESVTVIAKGGGDPSVARAAQKYLESKLPKSSKTVRQSQIKPELETDSAASE